MLIIIYHHNMQMSTFISKKFKKVRIKEEIADFKRFRIIFSCNLTFIDFDFI